MRQRRRVEYLEDYQFTLSYHPGKANVIVDALSRKIREIVANISIKEWEMPRRGVVRFGKKGKLSPRYIGPFEILDKIGEVAYRLALPPQLAEVHNVFHGFMPQKYEPHSSHIINWEEINIDEDVTFKEKPVKILDRHEKKLRGKTIPLVRVLWRHRGTKESTWERKDMIRANYPQLFESKGTN
ncbi:uncharacterized protein LOC114306654 [Camellia sinensis]|uniref:uncharacterized protein LOC114306654 n=1 Tax=Camellia sinensis TaxID=4442 RepID=UPI00103695C8|nr:uncharacterized protein LOC114306654 [Camellia sinensis]